jgi:hypothetical protein
MKILIIFLMLVSAAVQAETIIYQTDSIGNIQYHKDYTVVKADGKVVQVSPSGNTLYHKQQYKIVGNQIKPIDSIGNNQAHKSGYISSNGVKSK